MNNFTKIALAAAVSLASFNASATDWTDKHFDSVDDISNNLGSVYEIFGGDLADFISDGDGGHDMAELLLQLSDFQAAEAPSLEVNEDDEIVMIGGREGVGDIESINEKVQSTMESIESDLLGDGSWEFDDEAADDTVATDANSGLAKDTINTINNELVDIVAAADGASDDATSLAAFNTEFNSYFNKESGGFQDDADKYNEVVDAMGSLAAGVGASASDYLGGFTDHASFSDFDVDTVASSVSASIDDGVVSDHGSGLGYDSYLDMVQDGDLKLAYDAAISIDGFGSIQLSEGNTSSDAFLESGLFVGSLGGEAYSMTMTKSGNDFSIADFTFDGVTITVDMEGVDASDSNAVYAAAMEAMFDQLDPNS